MLVITIFILHNILSLFLLISVCLHSYNRLDAHSLQTVCIWEGLRWMCIQLIFYNNSQYASRAVWRDLIKLYCRLYYINVFLVHPHVVQCLIYQLNHEHQSRLFCWQPATSCESCHPPNKGGGRSRGTQHQLTWWIHLMILFSLICFRWLTTHFSL